MKKQLSLILALSTLLIVFWSLSQKKSEEKNHLLASSPIEKASQIQKTVELASPAGKPSDPDPQVDLIDPSTKNFLKLIAEAQNPEDVFAKESAHVLANYQEDRWVTHGDILVNEKNLIKMIDGSEIAIMKIGKVEYWPMNIVPYEIDPALIAEPIRKAIEAINGQTNIRFIERHNENDYVYFRFTHEKKCLSYLGKIGGEQDILLNPEECQFGKILHEMLHAIGFIHEHSREDRDKYVNIHWDQIKEGAKIQFQKLSAEVWPPSDSFDFESLLLYPSNAFQIGDHPTISKKDGAVFEVNRAKLSSGDIQKINHIYKKIEE